MNKIGQTPVAANASAVEAEDIFGQGAESPLDVSSRIPPPAAAGSARAAWRMPDIIFILGMLALAIPTMIFVAQSSWTGEQGSHGPIILATGLWLVWHNWHEVRGLMERAPAWKVAALFVALLPVYLFTRITQIVELEGYAMYMLLLVALYGIIGFRAMRALAFPLIYLFFAFPPPETVIYTLVENVSGTSTSGSGEASGLEKVTETAMPNATTAQLVVLSRRVRQIVLRYTSPR
mgnify:CR=1 FL=1